MPGGDWRGRADAGGAAAVERRAGGGEVATAVFVGGVHKEEEGKTEDGLVGLAVGMGIIARATTRHMWSSLPHNPLLLLLSVLSIAIAQQQQPRKTGSTGLPMPPQRAISATTAPNRPQPAPWPPTSAALPTRVKPSLPSALRRQTPESVITTYDEILDAVQCREQYMSISTHYLRRVQRKVLPLVRSTRYHADLL